MKWSKKEEKFLIENFNKYSIDELSEILDRTNYSIYAKASALKLSHQEFNKEFMRKKSRKYHIDHNYFEEIDTEDKAYFLGLFFADGYNYEKKHHMSISLYEKDKDILIKFNKSIKNGRPLFYKEDKRKGRLCNSYISSFN